MARDWGELVSKLGSLLQSSSLRNFQAQAHARTMLSQLGTPAEEWPRFSTSLDERLYHASHLMLVRGMELIDFEEHADLARELLLRAAEALEFQTDIPQSRLAEFDERLNAAIGYHVAGYHARSYVLLDQLAGDQEASLHTDEFASALLALLRRDLRGVAVATLRVLNSDDFDEARLAGQLREGAADDDDVIAALGRRSLCAALLKYLEYAKQGQQSLIEQAREQAHTVAVLGQEARHVDLWWLGLATEKLLRDLGDSSLWTGLADLAPESPFGGAIARYVEAALIAQQSTTTLWPSQMKALKTIKAPDSPSFCIRMPTSAGKTKIAEFCIIRSQMEAAWGEAKCLYVAPFRSLAVEVEQTLSKALNPLGIRVSEIYGGFDLTASDERLIQDTQVLVATPEKFDATIRLAPEILDKVKLVIVDEGHIAGEVSERGIRAEFLINRLLWRLGRERCRHVFISAVLPNPQEFAAWIGGGSQNLVESDWRPSRLVLGECEWSKQRGSVRVSFTHEGSKKFKQEIFIQPFVKVRRVKGVSGCGRRVNPFPHDAKEAFACSAIRFAEYGTTLAFVPQARQVDGVAEAVLKSSSMMEVLARHEGDQWKFTPPDPTTSRFTQALEAIVEELGEDSKVEKYLRAGVAVHRGNLPARVRVAIERLIRSGEIRLIVATTTLGQGVNLPIRTVLVRGLQQDQYSKVNAMTFWNIAGRAGRAMKENEGQVLFFNDVSRPDDVVKNQRHTMNQYISRTAVTEVIGLLHRILAHLVDRWQMDEPTMDFVELCQKLAEDDFNWVVKSKRERVRDVLGVLDHHLLSLAIEGDFGPDQLDSLQEVLRESLLFTQLEAHPIEDLDQEAVITALASRVRYVFGRVPQQTRREQFYKMGMTLSDCESIEGCRDELLALSKEVETWEDLDEDGRVTLLCAIAQLAEQVDATSAAIRSMPENSLQIVKAWLQGQRCIDMIESGLGDAFDSDAGKLSQFIENYCVYGLTWVVSGFVSFARRELEDNGEELPVVVEHIPAMFKVGVSDPIAAMFVPYLQMDRSAAKQVASVCPHRLDEIAKAIAWLHGVDKEDLLALGVSDVVADQTLKKRRRLPDLDLFDLDFGGTVWSFQLSDPPKVELQIGDPIIIHPRQDISSKHFNILNMNGVLLDRFELASGDLPDWMRDFLSVDATVVEIKEHAGNGPLLKVRIREIGS